MMGISRVSHTSKKAKLGISCSCLRIIVRRKLSWGFPAFPALLQKRSAILRMQNTESRTDLLSAKKICVTKCADVCTPAQSRVLHLSETRSWPRPILLSHVQIYIYLDNLVKTEPYVLNLLYLLHIFTFQTN